MMKQRRSKEEDSEDGEDSDEQQQIKEMHEDSSKMKMMKFCGFEEKLKLEEEEDDETVACFHGSMQQYVRVYENRTLKGWFFIYES